MQLLAEIAESDVASVQAGSQATFQIESIGHENFEGTVSSVRLQPVVQQAPAPGTAGSGATAPPAAAPAGPIGTAGTSSPPAGPAASGSTAEGSSTPSGKGVVTYIAVIDVNNENGTVPPGSSAIVYLPANERRGVMRVPNKALTFRPS